MGTIKCIGILTSGGDAPGMNALPSTTDYKLKVSTVGIKD